MFTPRELALERGWPGRIEGDRVIQLAAQTLQSYFTGGGEAREHAEYELDDVDLRPPVLRPPSVRDFMAFEEHVATARRQRGSEVPPEWYAVPVFYFSNPTAIFGPEEVIPWPDGTEELDYELECAAVIGADGAIGGFTVLNDWSARVGDVLRESHEVAHRGRPEDGRPEVDVGELVLRVLARVATAGEVRLQRLRRELDHPITIDAPGPTALERKLAGREHA